MDENEDTTTAIAVHRVRRAEAALAKSERAASNAMATCDALDRWGASFAVTLEMFAPFDHAAVDRAVLKEVLDDIRVTESMPEAIMMVVLNRRFQVTPIREWCERNRALGGPAITPGWL